MRRAAVLLLIAPAIAGCLTGSPSTGPAVGPDPGLPGVANSTLSTYLHDLSEPDPDVSVDTALLDHVRIPTPDGPRLDAWIVRPDTDEPVPIVLEVTPYWGGGNPREDVGIWMAGRDHGFGKVADVLVPRGYAYGIVSVRGTGNSEGCFTIGGPSEAEDTAAAIEHLATQDWSNGKVGLIGASYPGTTPQDVWVEAPEHLETIVPAAGISDLYKYNFVRGVPISIQGFGFNTYYWATVGLSPAGLAGGTQVTDPAAVPGAVAGEVCEDQIAVQEGGVSSTLDGNKDSYWQERDFLAELYASPEKDRASVFYIHGLQDWNVKPHNMRGWLPALQASDVPFKAWLGQWAHDWPQAGDGECPERSNATLGGETVDRACRDDWWNATMVAWFDRFLKDRETGILDAPAVQVQDDDMVWRHEEHWPPRDVDRRTLHPTSNGGLDRAPGDGQVTYWDHRGGLVPDTDATPDGEAVFVSEPLEEDLHLSGIPRYVGDVSASGDRASLMLTLAERTDDGDRAINYAAQSLNHVDRLKDGRESVAEQTLAVDVPFFPQDDVVHEGNRLVLIAAGNLRSGDDPGPPMQPVSSGSDITLHLDGAKLVLPVDRTVVPEDPAPNGDGAE